MNILEVILNQEELKKAYEKYFRIRDKIIGDIKKEGGIQTDSALKQKIKERLFNGAQTINTQQDNQNNKNSAVNTIKDDGPLGKLVQIISDFRRKSHQYSVKDFQINQNTDTEIDSTNIEILTENSKDKKCTQNAYKKFEKIVFQVMKEYIDYKGYTLHHIVPLNSGGITHVNNLLLMSHLDHAIIHTLPLSHNVFQYDYEQIWKEFGIEVFDLTGGIQPETTKDIVDKSYNECEKDIQKKIEQIIDKSVNSQQMGRTDPNNQDPKKYFLKECKLIIINTILKKAIILNNNVKLNYEALITMKNIVKQLGVLSSFEDVNNIKDNDFYNNIPQHIQ